MHSPQQVVSEEVAQLIHTVRTQAQWMVPENVGYQPEEGVSAGRWMLLGWGTMMVVPATYVMVREAPWAAVAMWAVLLGGGWAVRRFLHRAQWPLGHPMALLDTMPLQWRGCVVDVAQRTIRSQGVRNPQQWLLTPAQEWSLGVMNTTTRREHNRRLQLSCVVELRHVRRGPVAQLCWITMPHYGASAHLEVEALVDAMAQRLGIRRSGEGLLPQDSTRSLLR